jgi:ABC-type branched-subunit amino acid transport system substrate-binding protein
VSRDAPNAPTPLPVLDLRCEAHGPASYTFTLGDCRARDGERDVSSSRRVVLWHDTLERFGAEQLNARYRAAAGKAMTSDAWLGWFAIKVLFEAALRTRSTDAARLVAYLRAPTTQFDGHKGAPLRFDAQGRLMQPVYVIVRDGASGAWTVEREI